MLASASQIRSQILDRAGVSHICQAADIDEGEIKKIYLGNAKTAEETAMALAEAKAAKVCEHHEGGLVIGADQILECDGRWFDKPSDKEAAKETLRALRDRAHALVTAVAVFRNGEAVWRHLETPRLVMRNVSDAFIERYVLEESPDILASVGAYRLEQKGAQLFEHIDGNYFTVLGLPLLALLEFLRQAGVLEE